MMRGLVFQTFLSAVEAHHGLAMVDAVLEAVPTRTGGAYTAVGSYEDAELVALASAYADRIGRPVGEVLRPLGQVMFEHLLAVYRGPALDATCTYELLERIDGTIHVSVRKLDPEAQPPRFECRREGDALHVRYSSARALSVLAVALVEGCAAHFGERFHIDVTPVDHAGTVVDLLLRPAR